MQNYFATLLFSSECLSQPALPLGAAPVFAVTHRRLAGRGRAQGHAASSLSAAPAELSPAPRCRRRCLAVAEAETLVPVPWGPVSSHLGQPRADDANALRQLCPKEVFHGGGGCPPSPDSRPAHGHPIPLLPNVKPIPCPDTFCCPTSLHHVMLLSDPELPQWSQVMGSLVVSSLQGWAWVPGAGVTGLCSVGPGRRQA